MAFHLLCLALTVRLCFALRPQSPKLLFPHRAACLLLLAPHATQRVMPRLGKSDCHRTKQLPDTLLRRVLRGHLPRNCIACHPPHLLTASVRFCRVSLLLEEHPPHLQITGQTTGLPVVSLQCCDFRLVLRYELPRF